MISDIDFPIYNWHLTKLTKYSQLPRGYWDNISNQQSFLNDLAKKLNITSPSGWHKMSGPIIEQHGGAVLLNKYNGSITKLLSTVYPEYHILHIMLIFYLSLGFTQVWTGSERILGI